MCKDELRFYNILFGFLLAIAIGGFIVFSKLYSERKAKARSKELQKFALLKGFEFDEKANLLELLPSLDPSKDKSFP